MPRALCVLLLLCASLYAQDEARVKALLADLGADEPAKREAASAELAKLGAADGTGQVERLIGEASQGKDAEVTSRCRALLDGIRYWERLVVCGGETMGAIDLATGGWAWKRRGFGEAWAGRRQRGGFACLAPNEGGLECVDLRSGATRWRYDGVPHGEQVGPLRWVGYEGAQAVCIALPSGQVSWKAALGGDVNTIRPPALAADNDAAYVCMNTGLVALEGATGKALWTREGQGYERLRLVQGGLYACAKYAGTPAYVRRIDRATGKDLWRCEIPTELEPTPVMGLSDEKVVLVSSLFSGREGWTCAIDVGTGKPLWTLHTPSWGAWCDLGAGRLWLATPMFLVVVDESNGKELWRDTLTGDAAAFLLEGNHLCVAGYEGISCGVSIAAYDPSKLVRLWTADVKGIQVPHSEYYQRVRIERLGPRLLLVGETAGGTFVEVVDPETGKTTARFAQR